MDVGTLRLFHFCIFKLFDLSTFGLCRLLGLLDFGTFRRWDVGVFLLFDVLTFVFSTFRLSVFGILGHLDFGTWDFGTFGLLDF